jgi:hypothetical protein
MKAFKGVGKHLAAQFRFNCLRTSVAYTLWIFLIHFVSGTFLKKKSDRYNLPLSQNFPHLRLWHANTSGSIAPKTEGERRRDQVPTDIPANFSQTAIIIVVSTYLFRSPEISQTQLLSP